MRNQQHDSKSGQQKKAHTETVEGMELHVSATVRWVFFIAGLIFLLLGLVGAVLPLLPTTPFILLAAASFARSSERFYQLLLHNEYFGPSIRDWHQYHCMAQKIKIFAIGMIVIGCLMSAWMLRQIPYMSTIMLLIMAALIVMILRISTCRQGESVDTVNGE